MDITTKVHVALQGHLGSDQGITAEQLAAQCETTKRAVRSAVTELRLEGVGICGHPKTGYYIAANDEEIEATCAFLRSRALHSLTLESRLRKCTLPDLLGQLHLKT